MTFKFVWEYKINLLIENIQYYPNKKIMSCCGGGNKLKENFNAGNPPLGYSGYPGSEFPGTCGGGGGYGHYGTYGGCPTYDHYDKSSGHAYSEYDSMDAVHEPECACQACQTPYSVAYSASPKACGCVGSCGCNAGVVSNGANGANGVPELARVSADLGGQPLVGAGLRGNGLSAYADVAGTNLLDFGVGDGMTAHARIPFLGVTVDLLALVRFVILLCVISLMAYFLFGFKLRMPKLF